MPKNCQPLLALALLLVFMGCTGGQTGDITELTACERPSGTLRADEVPDGFSEPLTAIVTGALYESTALQWAHDRSETELEALWSVQGDSVVQLLGDGNCPRQVRTPVELGITTQDGLLDEQVSGFAVLMADGSGYVHAEQFATDVSGALDPLAAAGTDPDPSALLVWRITVNGEGKLLLSTAGNDELLLATW